MPGRMYGMGRNAKLGLLGRPENRLGLAQMGIGPVFRWNWALDLAKQKIRIKDKIK